MIKQKIQNYHLWFLPFMAIVFCGWFLARYYNERGTQIHVIFQDASSIYPKKTRVMFKGVPIGVVTAVAIAENSEGADCEITLYRGAERFAQKGTKFILVTPQIGLGGVTGLETILSGSYISVEKNSAEGTPQIEFRGIYTQSDNLKEAAQPGLKNYLLKTEDAESVGVGDSVYYRGLIIGKVIAVELSQSAQLVNIAIGIEQKYSRLIRDRSVFWKKRGIKANVGLFGAEVKIGALDTLMKGGIELGIPNESGSVVRAGFQFNLLNEEPEERRGGKWKPALAFR